MGFFVIICFVILFALGFPVVIALAAPSILYLVLNGFSLEMLTQRFQYSIFSFTLIAVPVFIFVGNLMNTSGITKRIFAFADTAVGRLPGGLAQVNALASLIFSGMSGAALADIGGLGQMIIKSMKEKGFTPSFSAAVTCATATVGPIFPPSIPLVVYASVANVSLVRLLIGGIIPAILAVILMMILIAVLALFKNYPRAERWPTLKEFFDTLLPALPALLAPIIMVAGMLIGIFTPTESASITVLYIVLINIFIYREFSIKHLISAAFKTIKLTGSVLIIFPAAALFNWVLTVEQIPQLFSTTVLSFTTDPYVMLLVVNIMLLIVGMFIGGNEAILLIVPIILKPLMMLGIDPIHLGIVVVFNLMLGLITPPFALSLFLTADIAKVKVNKVVRDVVPFYIPLLITLAIITYLPKLILWLPNLF